MYSNKKLARVAGLLFLILVLCGVFAEFFVRSKMFVPGDTVATIENIKASEWLFRLGIVSDLVMSIAFFFFPFALYLIFKQINTFQSKVMVASVMIAVAIYCMNMLNQVAVLLLTSGADYLNAFETDQLDGLAIFFLKMHTNGYFIDQIFYGLYLLPLGYMIFKSGIIPKIIGIMLMLGCIGDLIDVGMYFLFPNHESVFFSNITIPADIGEISLCLWLLIKGVKDPKEI
ncbi:DUF4386 domain-containing protein [Aquimarina sp. 2304DJ70-9]|uniref:DUF4386 domain-containing protein n=1 Tax=Aquimarina penaris TaxID=3231044 RepID=UPI003462F844